MLYEALLEAYGIPADKRQAFYKVLTEKFICLPTAILANKDVGVFCAPNFDDAKAIMEHHLNFIHDPKYQEIMNAKS